MPPTRKMNPKNNANANPTSKGSESKLTCAFGSDIIPEIPYANNKSIAENKKKILESNSFILISVTLLSKIPPIKVIPKSVKAICPYKTRAL